MQYGDRIVTSGLVLALDAGSTKSYPGSGTTWFDRSGNNGNATLYNGPTFSSANGGSIVFDSTNDYARTVSLILTGSETALTINCWFKPSIDWAIASIVALGDESNGKRRMLLQRAKKIEANGYNNDFQGTPDVLATNIWCFLSVVYSSYTVSSGIVLYFNGYPIAGTGSGTLSAFTNKTCTINGNNAATPGELPGGNIAHVSIYNKSLTAAEILQNYNATRRRFGL